MKSAEAMLRMSRYEAREHRGLLAEAHRPDLVHHLNAHPELVDSLLAKAEENKRWQGSVVDDLNV